MPRMGLTHTSRRIAGWLAILAMALNALWPLAANAKPAGAFDLSTEICTVGGVKSFAGGSGIPQPANTTHQPNCSFCTFGADKLVLPSVASGAVLAVMDHAGFAPQIPQMRPLQPQSYYPAHPRAPPALS